MNKLIITLIFVTSLSGAQTAFHNFGNVQIHNGGEIGFHTNLINDGTFNQNLGFAGFFNTSNSLTISGTEIPRFFDMEVDVDDNILLEINTEVINSLFYTNGDVITPRNTPNISLDFLNDVVYLSEDNLRLTDGYASYSGNNGFIFPIGDDNKLRPLITPFQNNNPIFSAAYFNEDPNFPSTFPSDFDTSNSEGIINAVSIDEFWDFSGTKETQVTLTWDSASNIPSLVDELQNLRVVGWNISENRWLDLGNAQFTGTPNSGTITSALFIPNEYEVITFGSLIGTDGIEVFNLVTPNEDGLNDVFRIEGIELFQNNLKIYNRWGRLVYDINNYQNDWDGISNQSGIFGDRNDKLPTGTYFYVLNILEENSRSIAGYLYIQN